MEDFSDYFRVEGVGNTETFLLLSQVNAWTIDHYLNFPSFIDREWETIVAE